ncbi:MAG: hypothetical protein PHR24_00940, partial [Oscillospiraceae bacterium]|nr:hypothetical protein [Oscillospiraceae bacterium]
TEWIIRCDLSKGYLTACTDLPPQLCGKIRILTVSTLEKRQKEAVLSTLSTEFSTLTSFLPFYRL